MLALDLLVVFIALQHVGFMVLEMFFWTRPLGLKVFRQTPEKARASAVLAANQGLYNGFLSAGLAWSLMQSNEDMALQLKGFFLTCVLVAGLYGARTVGRSILFVQALPAAIALLVLLLL